jgi:hypothetical protein
MNGKNPQSQVKESMKGRIRLWPYTKGITIVYLIMVAGLVGVEMVEVRRPAITGVFHPMNLSNLHLVGVAVGIASFLLLILGFGYGFLQLAKTTFSSWGIERPSWLGGSVPWSAVTRVTPYLNGLRFHTNRRLLFFPFRLFDSFPPELLDLISEHVPKSSVAGLARGSE